MFNAPAFIDFSYGSQAAFQEPTAAVEPRPFPPSYDEAMEKQPLLENNT